MDRHETPRGWQADTALIGLLALAKLALHLAFVNRYGYFRDELYYLACGRPVLSSRMISLEKLLGDEIYYFDDVESFIAQVNSILSVEPTTKRFRSLAERYDWRAISKDYQKVLLEAAD